MIRGRATPEGTRRRAAGRSGYRPLGSTGLTVSAVGFGGYRTGRAGPAHREALREALRRGVNLVDTSSNYMFGDSERLIGEVLAEELVPRDEVVVVTKIGYVQGPNLELAQQREAEGRPFPEMVKYQEGCWHCMAPEFLDDQLGRALGRLGLETVDGLLIHNPEYFFSEAAHHDPPPPLEAAREVFYDRLRRAFEYLDGAVRDGRIDWYGVSSNTCVVAADQYEATSVARMHEASGGRMSVLQLPYNLVESGALLERNTPEGTALEAAAARDLGVLVNRPLNAMANGRLIRLADPPREDEPGGEAWLRERLDALARRERTLALMVPLPQPLGVAALLERCWDDARDPLAWALVARQELIPEARRGLGEIVAAVGQRPPAPLGQQLLAYQDELNAMLERLHERAQLRDPGMAQRIRQTLGPRLPAPLRDESLSRLALGFVASSPGVSCVLNGMRHPAYVRDAVGVLDLPPLPDVEQIARAFAVR